MERSNTEGAQLRNLSEEMRTANASIAPEFTRLHAREAQRHRMLLPSEVAAVIQEVTGEPGCHNDPRLLRRARSNTRFVRQKMKIGHEALALRPACVFGVFFVKRRKNPSKKPFGSLLTAVRPMFGSLQIRLWSSRPATVCGALKSTRLAHLQQVSGLALRLR